MSEEYKSWQEEDGVGFNILIILFVFGVFIFGISALVNQDIEDAERSAERSAMISRVEADDRIKIFKEKCQPLQDGRQPSCLVVGAKGIVYLSRYDAPTKMTMSRSDYCASNAWASYYIDFGEKDFWENFRKIVYKGEDGYDELFESYKTCIPAMVK